MCFLLHPGGAIAPLACAVYPGCADPLVGWDCLHYEMEEQMAADPLLSRLAKRGSGDMGGICGFCLGAGKSGSRAKGGRGGEVFFNQSLND